MNVGHMLLVIGQLDNSILISFLVSFCLKFTTKIATKNSWC